jgi:hypothetical protein
MPRLTIRHPVDQDTRPRAADRLMFAGEVTGG